MLSIQKFASDRTGLGYGLSSSNTDSTSTTVFVPLASNTEIENIDVKIGLVSENLDEGKSILRAPPKLDKKDIKNPKAKKADVHEIYTIKYSHIYIFSLTFMLFCVWLYNIFVLQVTRALHAKWS